MTSRGFTLVELVTVMILIGILAVVALPRLDQAGSFGAAAFRDRVAATLRYAQKSAVAKRRMVCATIAADRIALRVAGTFGATGCDAGSGGYALPGPDGLDPAAVSSSADARLATPVGPLYFQPSGAATSDANGATVADFSLTVTGQTPITVNGATGYVN
jgi:MSHA pilin protein MshC